MFVTNEHARTMLCAQTGAKRLTCVAEQCMSWRPVVLYAAYVISQDHPGARGDYTNYVWKTEKQAGATAVDCGFCGLAGAPLYTAEVRAPLGYDETSLPGLQNHSRKVEPARSLNKHEKALLKARGKIIEHDDGVRSPSGQFRFTRKKKRD